MKAVASIVCFVGWLVAIASTSHAGKYDRYLQLVDSHPKERLLELVRQTPPTCRIEVQKAIFERRGVIVDYFGK